MECLLLPAQDSTASTAQKGSGLRSTGLLLCSASYNTRQSLAHRAMNAWDLTFGRTQLAHHAPSGHSLQRLTDQLRTPDTAQQPHGQSD